jgi:hypothetical protein
VKLKLNELRSIVKEVIEEAEFNRLTKATKGTVPKYTPPQHWPEQGQQQQQQQDKIANGVAYLLNQVLRNISRTNNLRYNTAMGIIAMIPEFNKTTPEAIKQAFNTLTLQK